jgi:predicted ArsR family transcriptional regulator
MDLGSRAAGIGALADATRRALYEYVTSQPDPVGREQAAEALGLALHNVAFHLDRLVSEGLLEVEFRRLSGRAGPGAGRPNKLYRRASQEFVVSLPPRRYDLVGDILATAVDRAGVGESLDQALHQAARDEGSALAATAETLDPTLATLGDLLKGQGYEPQIQHDVLRLANCPFDALARKHTALVCGLNQSFVQGVADGLGGRKVTAHLEPEPGRCCVAVRTQGQRPVADRDHDARQ